MLFWNHWCSWPTYKNSLRPTASKVTNASQGTADHPVAQKIGNGFPILSFSIIVSSTPGTTSCIQAVSCGNYFLHRGVVPHVKKKYIRNEAMSVCIEPKEACTLLWPLDTLHNAVSSWRCTLVHVVPRLLSETEGQ